MITDKEYIEYSKSIQDEFEAKDLVEVTLKLDRHIIEGLKKRCLQCRPVTLDCMVNNHMQNGLMLSDGLLTKMLTGQEDFKAWLVKNQLRNKNNS